MLALILAYTALLLWKGHKRITAHPFQKYVIVDCLVEI
jgi:hypothetical protein